MFYLFPLFSNHPRIMKSSAFALMLVTVSAAFISADGRIIDGYSGNETDPTSDPTMATTAAPFTDEYADEILKRLRVAIVTTGMDPLMLPLKAFEFSKTILGVRIGGTAKVYDGSLSGLGTIHRTGLASMKTRTENGNKTITIRATVGVNDLTGIYKASAKFMGFGPRFNVKLGIDSIGCAFEVEQLQVPGSKPKLLSFYIVDVGRITTELDGPLGILDWILNTFNNFVINIVSEWVAMALGLPMKIIIQEILNSDDLPKLPLN